MLGDPEKITYFAETDYRNNKVPFGIKAKDRTRHVYVIGKTGMGKSTLLENMAIQDIIEGEGMAFIDPHGGTAEKLLDYIPEHRIKDVIYFAPFDMDYPVSFNVMEDVGIDKRHLVASGLMSAFKKIWVDAWSARMEYILNNILLALLEYPNATLLGVNRMLADKNYRKKVVNNISDPSVKAFWVDEFAKYGDRYMQEAGAAIQNKIGQFVSNPIIRNIIGQPKSTFDIREVMDKRKILIMNLSKGKIGEQNSNLLGGMLITKIYLGAMSRADVSAGALERLPNFYFYVDEFQSFANESFADILSEARKYKLNLTIAHQYIEQMPEEVRAAVFGNVGTMIIFRVGSFDAEIFEKEFSPYFFIDDIVNLGFAQIYLKLLINGIGSKPFSAVTIPPIKEPPINFKEQIILNSRKAYSRQRAFVEEEIKSWHDTIEEEKDERSLLNKDFKKKEFNSTTKLPTPNYRPRQNDTKFQRSQTPLRYEKSQSLLTNQRSEKSQTEIKNNPPITTWKPDKNIQTQTTINHPKKQRSQMQKIEPSSPKLKELLNKLEGGTNPDSNFKNREFLTDEKVKIEKNENYGKTVPLSQLKEKVPQKDPSAQNLSQLKEVLNKALENRENKKNSIPPSQNQRLSISTESQIGTEKKLNPPKEVPEDVLKKILE